MPHSGRPLVRHGRPVAAALSMLEADPALGRELDDPARDRLTRFLRVPSVAAAPGPFEVSGEVAGGSLALLIVEGLLLRCCGGAGREHASLFGPEDLIAPWVAPAAGERWIALQPILLADLDPSFTSAARRIPSMLRATMTRSFETAQRQAQVAALSSMPSTPQRLLALFSLYAQRWGSAGSGGTLLDLPLTHEMLGHVVGARRSTVTLALTELCAGRLLHRRSDGRWWLPWRAGT